MEYTDEGAPRLSRGDVYRLFNAAVEWYSTDPKRWIKCYLWMNEDGLTSNMMLDEFLANNTKPPIACCLEGCLQLCAHNLGMTYVDIAVSNEIFSMLDGGHTSHIDWNDEHNRTFEEVIKLLHRIRDENAPFPIKRGE